MKIPRNYFILAITSTIGSTIILLTLFSLNNKAINTYSLVIVPVICIIISYFTSKILLSNYSYLFDKAKASLWTDIFIILNVYVGAAIGIVSGVILAWLLLYPYTLLVGNPETSSWSASKTHVFELLVLISTVMSAIFCIRYFFKAGIKYIKRKTENH